VVTFDQRIRLVEGMPALIETMAPLRAARQKLREMFTKLRRKFRLIGRDDDVWSRLMTIESLPRVWTRRVFGLQRQHRHCRRLQERKSCRAVIGTDRGAEPVEREPPRGPCRAVRGRYDANASLEQVLKGVARLFRYLDIGYIRCLMTPCASCLILGGVLIDQMVPFDRDAREGESAKSRTAPRPMMRGAPPTTCRHLLAVPALRRGAFADFLAVSEGRRKRNGTYAGAVWRLLRGKREAFLLDRLISAGQNGVLAPRLAAA
jgi:hypothetical protein